MDRFWYIYVHPLLSATFVAEADQAGQGAAFVRQSVPGRVLLLQQRQFSSWLGAAHDRTNEVQHLATLVFPRHSCLCNCVTAADCSFLHAF